MQSIPRHQWQSRSFLDAFRSLAVSPPIGPSLVFLRPASHATQTAVNSKKNGPGQRLGCKKSGGEKVNPSQIIFRQRGTKWFPGENCGMGRDHTIFAKEAGYVRYYKDLKRHPDRQYIGVVFEEWMKLPFAAHVPRRRRLGLEAVEMESPVLVGSENGSIDAGNGVVVGVRDDQGHTLDSKIPGPASASKTTFLIQNANKKGEPSRVQMRPGYMYRESNWEIGRTAERLNIKVPLYNSGNRFKAWRMRTARKQRIRSLKSSSKKRKAAK